MISIKKIIKCLCVVIFLVCSFLLVKLLLIDPHEARKSSGEVRKIFHTEALGREDKFKELIKMNSEIVGWIFISGTRIDYPVVQRVGDSSFYLNHNHKREPSRYGSIFIDGACQQAVDSKNIVLHGHHMNNGEMFADILKFADIEFYKKNPIIEFDTPKEQGSFKIFSVFKTNTLPEHGALFNYMIPEFNSAKSFLEFVSEIKKRSLINIPVDVVENDQIITLSTCSYEFKDFRTVVVARKMRSGESREIDMESVKKSANPLMPDCYYKK